MQIWDCGAGNPNQRIKQVAADELRVPGNCLAVAGYGTTADTEFIPATPPEVEPVRQFGFCCSPTGPVPSHAGGGPSLVGKRFDQT